MEISRCRVMSAFNVVIFVSTVYNTLLTLIMFIIPLYFEYLEISPVQIGYIISITGLVQMFLRIPSGIAIDLWGGKKMMALCFAFLAISIPFYIYGFQFMVCLIMAQILYSYSRTLFWPNAQSYITKIPGNNLGGKIGAFHIITSLGSIIGPLVSGFLLSYYGYNYTFIILAIATTISLYFVIYMPPVRPLNTEQKSINFMTLLRSIPQIMTNRGVIVASVCQFAAASPIALVSSFVPVYLYRNGMSNDEIGILISFLGISLILGGIFYAKLFHEGSSPLAWLIGMGGIGLSLVILNLFNSFMFFALSINLLGFSSCFMRILPIIIVSQCTNVQIRGTTISIVSTFWGISLFLIPILLGLIDTVASLDAGFILLAFPFLLLAGFTFQIFRWYDRDIIS